MDRQIMYEHGYCEPEEHTELNDNFFEDCQKGNIDIVDILKAMFQIEINIDPTQIDKNCMDEWGVAVAWINNECGIEYNLCYDNEICESAFYPFYKGEEMDTSNPFHYEIDFDDPEWRNKLVWKMIEIIAELVHDKGITWNLSKLQEMLKERGYM